MVTAITARAAEEQQIEIVEVQNCNELISAMKANKNIQLIADIDLANFDKSIYEFKGSINGFYLKDGLPYCYTLKNCKQIIAQHMVGATVKHVMLENCEPEWTLSNTDASLAGNAVLCRIAEKCNFIDIEVINSVVAYYSWWDGHIFPTYRRGGVLVSAATNCTFDAIRVEGCKVYVCSDIAGGVCAESHDCTFSNVYVDNHTFVHAQGDAIFTSGDAGGVVGQAYNTKFTNCENRAYVSSPMDNVGGIAAYAAESCQFQYCSNLGVLSHLDIEDYERIEQLASSLTQIELGMVFRDLRWYLSQCEKNFLENKITTWRDTVKRFEARKNELCVKRTHSWEYDPDASIDASVEYYFPEGQDKFIEVDEEFDNFLLNNPEPTFDEHYIGDKANAAMLTFQILMFVIDVAQQIYEAQDPDNIGGIVGYMEDGGSIVACANYGVVRALDAYSGGIAGEAEGTGLVIEHCLNAGAVTGYEQTGGIVGMMRDGDLRYCVNTGNIGQTGRSDKGTFGRIYGEKESGVRVTDNCYAGNITGEMINGLQMVSQQVLASGELGVWLNSQTDSTYWRQTVGADMCPLPSSDGDPIDSPTMINDEVDGCYHVSTVAQLIPALTNQYANIVLDNDIDLGGASIFNLSSRYMPFYGTIDGQGHKISNVCYNIEQKKNHTFLTIQTGNDTRELWTAIFPVAENATFRNLTLEDVIINYTGGEAVEAALLVSHSKNCRYENVHLAGKSGIIEAEGGGSYFAWKIGGLVSYSENDTFTDCSTGPDCTITATGTKVEEDANVGGLVSNSANSTFIRCFNQAKVEARPVEYLSFIDDISDVAGGILGWDVGGSTFIGCLNLGTVSGDEYIGGLVGKGTDTQFTNCMNLGDVIGDDEDAVGGIAGYLKGNKTLECCFSIGSINGTSSKNNNGIYVGKVDGSYTPDAASRYVCNQGANASEDELARFDTGDYAYTLNSAATETTWYQAIDDNYSFPTKRFVPIPAAGMVYSNYLCDAESSADRTHTYSNRYGGSADHVCELTTMGICRLCGYAAAAPEPGAVVDIATTTQLFDFASLVNTRSNYSALSARLTADIDLDGCNFPTIGSKVFPYKGKFDGQGHRIKNMKLEAQTDSPCGFFSVIGNGAEISNLVIDATCVISGLGTDVAGVAGVAWGDNSYSEFKVTITNCGNEADVTGSHSVAGILGRIDNSNVGRVEIKNCYNTGNIVSVNNPSAICAWIYKNFSIENCYNSGVVTGNDGKLFFHYQEGGDCTVSNCYDVNGVQEGMSVAQVTAEQVASGELCYLLNGSDDEHLTQNGFYQRVDTTGTHPCVTADEQDVVERVEVPYCDANGYVYYNALRNPVDQISTHHHFDEEGFCTAIAGETHYEEPEKVGNIYQIKNAGNLYWVAKQVNDGMEYPNCLLVNDIVVNANLVAQATGTCEGLRTWTPIGTAQNPYQNATFDGNGHTISGLLYKADTGNGVGLFGYAYNGAVIANLGVIDSYFVVTNGNGVGAIVGWGAHSYTNTRDWTDGNGPTLSNCYSDGKVWGNNYVGGLMGFAAVSTTTGNSVTDRINTCFSTAHVVGSEGTTGALFGRLHLQDDTAYCDVLPYCYSCSGQAFAMKDNEPDGELSCYETTMSEAEFHSGKVCDLLNHSEYLSSVHWAQDIAAQTTPAFGTGGVKLTRQIEKHWGTVILPYEVYSDRDVAYYVISDVCHTEGSADATITLTQMSRVPANTPCIFRTSNAEATAVAFCSEGRELTIPAETTVTSEVKGVSLVGTYQQVDLTDGFVNSDSAFWSNSVLTAEHIYVQPYCAYLNAGTTLDGVTSIYFDFVGDNFDFDQSGTFDSDDIKFLAEILCGSRQSTNIYDVTGDRSLSISDITALVNELAHPGAIAGPKPVITQPTATQGVIYGK